ncbi:3-hydroxyacyl-CoA dehydrogenase/enoyl-CoA hydratase/3-hydroxybutyryl-CoA epimerase [Actinocorallia herbida]|uniref:enoyl-CoA hydratase n=1 Tax=Actinocorallia herbida TaxID=58109 RepID=A0A3N1D457_9ACTN|nr:enoyl-CoA hydratase-related protein [Actinocorallia herbida]ROO87858.1 3-hydroxyacyl-CoA dehydrogenase/enoyl-CoA hydratase/3-hydroxybutyryl-CoA epimerase [Actinocorallia herbida]
MPSQHPMFDWHRDPDGVVVLTMNDPDHSTNTANHRFTNEFPAVLDRLEAERDSITGVVLTSAKKTFFAGADLTSFVAAGPGDVPAVEAMLNKLKADLRRLETFGRPVVAAINGTALGGGLEIALACHHRIAVDDPGVLVGLPESTLGLLPGAGGTVRTVRMFGIERALAEFLLPGTRFAPGAALSAGLLDEVVPPDDLLAAAKRRIGSGSRAVQPWDEPGYTIPGGAPRDAQTASLLATLPAVLRKKTRGAPDPAAEAILAAAVEGAQVDFDNAQAIESRYCAGLAGSQISSNIIEVAFFDPRVIGRSANKRSDRPRYKASKALVLGSGPVAEGVARACADAGVSVTVVADDLDTGHPTDVDVLIESAFDDGARRRSLLAAVAGRLAPGTLVLSNSSAFTIASLAESAPAPENVVGMHFFAPVDKMDLVEIVTAEKTGEEALAKAIDFARQLGKTSIVVGDRPGFFTTRVLQAFLDEALLLLAEGVPASSIERAATQSGYPVGALALLDDLSLPLMLRIRDEISEGRAVDGAESTTWHILRRLIDECARTGRESGAGFYDYDDRGRRRGLWSGLSVMFGDAKRDIAFADVQERLLFSEALEAIRCFDEGVVRSAPEANVGSVRGVGFPVWTGGVLRYADRYHGGLPGFAARCNDLARTYGARFEPMPSLTERASAGGSYS